MYLRSCGSSKSAKNNWVRKSQILKLLYLRKVGRSKQRFKSANLRIADLIFGPPIFAKDTCNPLESPRRLLSLWNIVSVLQRKCCAAIPLTATWSDLICGLPTFAKDTCNPAESPRRLLSLCNISINAAQVLCCYTDDCNLNMTSARDSLNSQALKV